MPKPTIAWLWRPGEATERRGTLSLDRDDPVFRADDGEEIRFPGLERARRQRGTPVLELRYLREGERRVAFLFFTRPPQRDERQPGLGVLAFRGPGRAAAITRMREANRRLKPLIEEWEEALRPRR